MTVSVIIPNYNHSLFLERRIESVINQAFQDLEVIILDDNSKDDSRKIIAKYKSHPKVSHIIFNEKNSGSVFRQWKKGIDLAKGSFIWIAESDDVAEIDFLKKLVPILESDLQIGLVYTDAKIIDENGIWTKKMFSDVRNEIYNGWNASYVHEGEYELNRSLLKWCSINNASAVLFRAKALKEIPIDLRQFYYGGDWATYIVIATNYKIAYLHEGLSFYRDHSQNASLQSFVSGKMYIDHFRIFQYCLENIHINKRSNSQYIKGKVEDILIGPYYSLKKHKYKYIKLIYNYFRISPNIVIRLFNEVLKCRIRRIKM